MTEGGRRPQWQQRPGAVKAPMVSKARERTEVSSGWAGDAAELSAR